jgi:hypothetical protein
MARRFPLFLVVSAVCAFGCATADPPDPPTSLLEYGPARSDVTGVDRVPGNANGKKRGAGPAIPIGAGSDPNGGVSRGPGPVPPAAAPAAPGATAGAASTGAPAGKPASSAIDQARAACGVPQCSGAGGGGVDPNADPNDPNADPNAAGCGCQATSADGRPLDLSCDADGCACTDDQGTTTNIAAPNACGTTASLEAAFAKCCLN